jgi:hypothetical protein
MKRITFVLTFLFLLTAAANAQQHQTQAPTATPQQQASRDTIREKLRTLLNTMGPKVNIDFRQSDKQPYNFLGALRTGLKNTEVFEVVVSVGEKETIHFRIYPHYNGGYINIDKVRDSAGLMRQLLHFSDSNFLYWGADETGDVFAGYNFTLESGFPDASIQAVLYSIAPLDKFVGALRPMIDGTQAPS